MTTSDTPRTTSRLGHWLPTDPTALDDVLRDLQQRGPDSREAWVPHPVIQEFQALIARDPVVRMYMHQMVDQLASPDPDRAAPPQSVDELLQLIDTVLRHAPEYDATALVGAPLNALLDRVMGTPAGRAAFRDDRVNGMVKKILQAWCTFLSSPDSCSVLNRTERGWLCPHAQEALKLWEYQHDPHDAYGGFSSWNDFFTRRFVEGARPVTAPTNDKVIVNACESTPYRIRTQVKERDAFWIKSQPYSLRDMLADEDMVAPFVGGTVYQAYLNVLNYHRWHSPVAGTIVRAWVQEGTYYSELDAVGEDPASPQDSQGYLTHVATRAIIVIDANEPSIGLVAAVFVGMVEVSSCVINDAIVPGRRVHKGEELGYFQYGGSTYCLVVRPDVIAEVSLEAIPGPGHPESLPVPLHAKLFTAR